MKPETNAMKVSLRKREVELQKIIRQMKEDQLESSKVYHNLLLELETLQDKHIQPVS